MILMSVGHQLLQSRKADVLMAPKWLMPALSKIIKKSQGLITKTFNRSISEYKGHNKILKMYMDLEN